jgi:hypothetical protein
MLGVLEARSERQSHYYGKPQHKSSTSKGLKIETHLAGEVILQVLHIALWLKIGTSGILEQDALHVFRSS